MSANLGEDGRWLAALAATVVAELGWWIVCFRAGLAPLPLLSTYLAFAFAALAAAYVLRTGLNRDRPRAPWPPLVLGAALTGIGGSLFLPLKFAIPKQVGFWLDPPLAAAERTLFNGDPWRFLDSLFGWATVPIDRLYGMWLPVQLLVMFLLMLEPASRPKSRALIAYALAWLVLGVVAATLLSSAGPIFYERLFGGGHFTVLGETLDRRGAWMTLTGSDAMWAAIADDRPGAVSGISAMPSLHVAISVWIYLTARTMAPRAAPYALAYAIFVWLASVQLGWHYVSDGLAGAAGMLLIWGFAGLAVRPAPSSPAQSA